MLYGYQLRGTSNKIAPKQQLEPQPLLTRDIQSFGGALILLTTPFHALCMASQEHKV